MTLTQGATTDFYIAKAEKDADGLLICPIEGCTQDTHFSSTRVLGLHLRNAHDVKSPKAATDTKAKRAYTKHTASTADTVAENVNIQSRVHYCPNCGVHIEELNVALHLLAQKSEKKS